MPTPPPDRNEEERGDPDGPRVQRDNPWVALEPLVSPGDPVWGVTAASPGPQPGPDPYTREYTVRMDVTPMYSLDGLTYVYTPPVGLGEMPERVDIPVRVPDLGLTEVGRRRYEEARRRMLRPAVRPAQPAVPVYKDEEGQ